jgi:hypothetical protein
MNAFNFDYVGNVWDFNQKKPYPDWVRLERFYNCENFGQLFSRRKPLLGRLFGKKMSRL